MTPVHPGCSCYHCQMAFATQQLREALQTAQAENSARAQEVQELRVNLRNLAEQVAVVNQHVVGLLREAGQGGRGAGKGPGGEGGE